MILITCPFGLSSLLTSELKHLWLNPENTFPTWTYINHNELTTIYKINLRSRIANKVFLQIGSEMVFSFDELFSMTQKLQRKSILASWNISISVQTKNSELQSNKAIQSICHKAISWQFSNSWWAIHEILVFIENNLCKIFVNTSGSSLHQRWRRTQTGEAPLKENLATGLILHSWRKFQNPLWDPFCGSGTILIEALMIAKNIAPWLYRNFWFQDFVNFDQKLFLEIKEDAQSKIFNKKYSLKWTDINPENITIAKQNAKNLWFESEIIFETADFFQIEIPKETTVITNPPYGKRLVTDQTTYDKLIQTFEWKNFWWFMTSYPLKLKNWRKSKDVNNNWELCKIWKKI